MQHSRFCFVAATAVAATLTLSACGGSGNDTQTSAATSAASSPAVTGGSGAEQDHNDSDVMFARGMIPHHQQAIEMSDMLLAKQGISPEVVALANDIKAAQSPEIEQMQGWLDQWGVAGSMPRGDMPTDMPADMPGHNMPGGGGMPAMSGHGMMSQADMAALQNAQGAEASRLFLTQMITHHEGAIMMAQQEIDSGKYPEAVAMARAIVTSQQEEITTMRGMLDAM